MSNYSDRIKAFEELKAFMPEAYVACRLPFTIKGAVTFGEKQEALIRLGLAVGIQHPGCVQSGVRKCLRAQCSPAEIRQIVQIAFGTLSMPLLTDTKMWIEEALANEKTS